MEAVLFIHGFGARKEDNEYFINYLKNKRKIDIFTFVLPGHEQERMTKVSYKEWIKKSEEELNKILLKYSSVTVVAHSMGCILAVNLAVKYKEINKLVMIAPAFIFGNLNQNKEDIKNIIKKDIDKNIGTGFEGYGNKIKNIPLVNMIEYRVLANKSKKLIKDITCQTLILQGNKDNLVSVNSSKYVYQQLNCQKEFVIIKNCRHQVFKSTRKKDISIYIYDYIKGGILYKLIKRKEI